MSIPRAPSNTSSAAWVGWLALTSVLLAACCGGWLYTPAAPEQVATHVVADRPKAQPIELTWKLTVGGPHAELYASRGGRWVTLVAGTPIWGPLPGEPVRSAEALRDGQWVFCRGDGLLLGDPETGALSPLAPASPEGCQAVSEALDGRIWAWDANGRLSFTADRQAWTTLVPPLGARLRWAFIGEELAWAALDEHVVQVTLATGAVVQLDPAVEWRLPRPRAVGMGEESSLFLRSRDGAREGLLRVRPGRAPELVVPLASVQVGRDDSVHSAIDHRGVTWVSTDSGVFRVSEKEVRPLMGGVLVNRTGDPVGRSLPRVALRGEEVWGLSRRGQVVRVEAGALVEEASLGALYALAVGPDGDIWVGGEGRVWRRARDASWRSWDVRLPAPSLSIGASLPRVQALVPDEDGTMLLGTSSGLLRLDPVDGALRPLPLSNAAAPNIVAAERRGNTLYLGATHGLYIVRLVSLPLLPSRQRLEPYSTHGLDGGGADLLVASGAGIYRVDALGLTHALRRRPFLCHGSCGEGTAITHGDRVAWIAAGRSVEALTTGWQAPGSCGRWNIPTEASSQSWITDLALAPDGTLWAATLDGLQALDTAACAGRTLFWPSAGVVADIPEGRGASER